MKTRTGFVSNSSSSSFILITSKANHERAMAQLDSWERKIVESTGIENFELEGVKVIKFYSYNEHECSTVFDIMENELPNFEEYPGENPCSIFSKEFESEEAAAAAIEKALWDYREETEKGVCITHEENH